MYRNLYQPENTISLYFSEQKLFWIEVVGFEPTISVTSTYPYRLDMLQRIFI